MTASELRTPRERTLFSISAIVSALAWLLIVVSLVGIVYGLFIAFFVLVAHALYLAHVTGNGVRVGPQQLPELHEKIVAASKRLGLERPPEAYVVQAGGLLNAFATKLLSRNFIVIYSDLIEAAAANEDLLESDQPSEVDFVIAHEIGHLAAGHLKWNAFLLPARIIPLLGPAYSRACEYTCDACGHEVVGDLAVSSRALAILAVGGHTSRAVDIGAFVQQTEDTGRFWSAVYELNSTHPYLSKRVARLHELAGAGTVPKVSRNPLAYPLAPVFGFGGGAGAGAGILVVVAMIGIIAAIAVPNLLNAIQRGKQKRTMSDLRSVGSAVESFQVDNGFPPPAETYADLTTFVQPTYIKQLPSQDGWQRTFDYYVWQTEEGAEYPDSYAIVSAGKDRMREHDDLSRYTGGATTSFNADIIFYNGSFIRYPEGAQN